MYCDTQIWVVTHNQYKISVLVSLTSFHGETSGGVPKCQLLFQVNKPHIQDFLAVCTAGCTLQVHLYIHSDQYEKCAEEILKVHIYIFSI